ncbi:hypothetical protein C8Q77DRAFT_1162127 [Trametes polyzona]|nr:hypothetical protein C8Q77DRAFT_1162127 [Trametes polyzona]
MPLFAIYAPDQNDPGALQRRLALRQAHKDGHERTGCMKFGGPLLTPNEALDVSDAPAEKWMVGSFMVYEASSYAEAKKLVEEDPFWTGDVWDKEKTVIRPLLLQRPLNQVVSRALWDTTVEHVHDDANGNMDDNHNGWASSDVLGPGRRA